MDKQDNNNVLKQENGQDVVVLRVDAEVLFSGDSYGLFVFKKTERIVSALYLLSGFMSDIEPLKNKIRTVAIDLLDNAIGLSNRIWGEDYFQKNLLKTLVETSVLFDLSKSVNMISKMNYEIISSELKKMANFLMESSNSYSSAKIAIEQNYFDGNYNYNSEQKNILDSRDDKVFSFKNDYLNKGQKDIKDTQTGNVLNTMSVGKSILTDKNQKDKSGRQDIIISMLKGGLKLTIKDFSKNIRDCSDKTIQRELLSMVSKGVLKKEGERRWSKYFLA
jgi:hypothetical protein